jgi:hypothetical protein
MAILKSSPALERTLRDALNGSTCRRSRRCLGSKALGRSRVSHADQDPAVPGEWPAPVRDQHVVDEQQVSRLPGKGSRVHAVCLRDLLQHGFGNGLPVPIGRVVGQVFQGPTASTSPSRTSGSRDVPEGEYAITVTDGIWQLDGTDLSAASETVERRRLSDTRSDRSMEIFSIVAQCPKPISQSEVSEKLGIDNDTVGR